MKRVFCLVSFAFLPYSKITAQNNLPPVYEIKTDTAFKQDLDNTYWQLLEDKKGKWTIEQVSTPPLSDLFRDSSSKLKATNTPVHTYWFRYRLKNIMNRETKIALDSYSEQDDFYVTKTGGKYHFVTGHSYPWSKKDGLKSGNYIPIILQAGEEIIVYDRSYNSTPGIHYQLRINFVNAEEAMARELYMQRNYVSISTALGTFFFGIFLLAAFFNFFFFIVTRERVYLYFSLFLFFFGFVNTPMLMEIFVREHPKTEVYINFLSRLWILFLFQFIRYYFQSFRFAPKWDKVLLSISIVWFFHILFTNFFSNSRSHTLNDNILFAVFTIIFLSLLITPFLFIHKNKSSTKSFLIAVLPFVLIFILWGLIEFLKIPVRIYSYIPALFFGSIAWSILYFSWILFKRYDYQKKEIAQQALNIERLAKEREIERSEIIAKQKIELENEVQLRTAELKHSLEDLKATQSLLIQKEKMASLGELSAGIAHEIQNPLNFINNFSEVNNELIEEMKNEFNAGNKEEAISIADGIKENGQKINHHGKRADAIVKGMLQHSRSSSGVKQPTDINKLADEYLRLSYHGFRAKDKIFTATLKTDSDESIGEINIVRQDIGRVLLNLYNNAFYAVTEKSKQQSENYQPTVSVSTKKINDKVEIRVKDNGNGIPQKVIDKIFQPFFTTKPTGQGTGLGLSLSYDIIQAHGGELKVETKEGEFAEFIILLPIV